MTVLNQEPSVLYIADGIKKTWDIPFSYASPADVHLYLRRTEGGAEEEITQYVSVAGRVLYFPNDNREPVAQGVKVLIRRQTPLVQPIDFKRQQRLDAQELENALDDITRREQELAEEVGRAVKFPASKEDGETDAAAYLQDLERAQVQAAQANTLAQESVAVAQEAAQTAAKASTDATAAAGTLSAYVEEAHAAKDGAETARTGAETAQTAAQSSATAAADAEYWANAYNTAARRSAEEAQASAAAALNSQTAAAASASGAAGSAEAALASQNAAQESARQAAQKLEEVKAEGAAQLSAVNTAGSTQTAAVNQAGTTQKNEVNTAGAAQKAAVESVGAAQTEAVNAAGSTQKNAIVAAGTEQKNAVNAAGQTQQEALTQNGAAQVQLAQDWAVKTDGPVSGGEYSAKKHALDAAQSAASINPSVFADKYLANVTTPAQTFKALMADVIAPDYTRGVSLASEQTYTADTAGWVWAFSRQWSYFEEAWVEVNGRVMQWAASPGGVAGTWTAAVMTFVGKGDVYKPRATSEIKFFPCKGA